MEQLIRNITGIYGRAGEEWLERLPLIVDKLSQKWNLEKIEPIKGMTFHYIAKAEQNSRTVIVKVGFDQKVWEDEIRALYYFKGKGAIKLLDEDSNNVALLLPFANPGISLKSLYPKNSEEVMAAYVKVMQQLHRPLVEGKYLLVSDWLKAIDEKLPFHLLKKGLIIIKELLDSPKQQVFLHGDLHLENILQNGKEWRAIDPKGIVGEAEFEAAAFDFVGKDEKIELLPQRIALLAKKGNLHEKRLLQWVFVRLLLSAAWWIEDNGNPKWDLKLAEYLTGLV